MGFYVKKSLRVLSLISQVMCSLVSFSIVRYVASHLRPMIDLFGPHHVSTVDDERISEIEHAFEVPWFLHVYRLLTCPKLGGEQHLEAEEIRRSCGGFRPWRSWKLRALCFSFAFGRASVQSGELTVINWLSLSGFGGWNVAICGIYEAFLGITCVSPKATVANYKQCKSSTSVSNNDVTRPQTHRVVCLCWQFIVDTKLNLGISRLSLFSKNRLTFLFSQK